VYLVYLTAWTDADGDIHFSADIYNHDRRLLIALLKRSPGPRFRRFVAAPDQLVMIDNSPAF
jgi:hypothetical protein